MNKLMLTYLYLLIIKFDFYDIIFIITFGLIIINQGEKMFLWTSMESSSNVQETIDIFYFIL